MNDGIKKHIALKESEKHQLMILLQSVEALKVSDETLTEVRAKISSRIAQCDISIRDHKKLLKDS